MKPTLRKALKKNKLGRATGKLSRPKPASAPRPSIYVIKCLFRHRKTRYLGLAKNTAQLYSLFGFADLVLARRFLGSARNQVASQV